MAHVDLAVAVGPSRQHLRRLKHVLDLSATNRGIVLERGSPLTLSQCNIAEGD